MGGAGALVAVSVVLVGLVGGAGWLTHSRDAESDARGVAASATSQSRTARPLTSESGTQRESLPADSTALPTPEAKARRILRGRVLGLSGAEVSTAKIRVDGLHRELVWPQRVHATGPLAADGSFTVDLAPLFEYRSAVDEMVVRAEHPRYVALEQRVLPERGVVDEHGDILYSAADVLVLPAAILRGRVEHDDGSPAEGARVLAFRFEAGRPQPESDVSVACASDGTFELKLAQSSEYGLAALKEGWRPATRLQTVVPGIESQLPSIRLERGSSISGRTLRLGKPEGGVEVYAGPKERGDVHLNHSEGTPLGFSLGWVGGCFEWSGLRVESETDALFQLQGLAPVEYQLRTSNRRGTRGSLGGHPAYLYVGAPSVGVELEFDATLITMDVRVKAADTSGGRILVRREDANPVTFSFRPVDGPATFVAPPNTALSLEVEVDGLSSRSFEIVTPGPGEELRRSVVLTPTVSARLLLEARGSTGHPIPGLRLEFFSPEQRETPSYYRSRVLELATELGQLSKTLELPPGAYWVVASVGDEEKRQRRSYYAPQEFGLELAPGETRTVQLEYAVGGLLRVEARTREKERQRVQFRLLDTRGETVPVVFAVHHETRGESESWWTLVPWAVNETARSLSPGTYELALWDDDLAEQRVPVRIVAGETTDIVVTLQPK
jgi:hypothetical protein